MEDFFNKLADADWTWWPLLSLRPPRDQKINNLRLLKLTAFLGTFAGLAVFLLGGLSHKIPFTILNALLWLALAWVFIFAYCKFLLALFWNRRAARLGKKA